MGVTPKAMATVANRRLCTAATVESVGTRRPSAGDRGLTTARTTWNRAATATSRGGRRAAPRPSSLARVRPSSPRSRPPRPAASRAQSPACVMVATVVGTVETVVVECGTGSGASRSFRGRARLCAARTTAAPAAARTSLSSTRTRAARDAAVVLPQLHQGRPLPTRGGVDTGESGHTCKSTDTHRQWERILIRGW